MWWLRLALRPPSEALFFVPIAAVIAIVAHTGNPLVARAITAIAVLGTVVAWISGVVLQARRGPQRWWQLGAHVVVALVAMAAVVYLAVDRDRLLDLLGETWQHGPE